MLFMPSTTPLWKKITILLCHEGEQCFEWSVYELNLHKQTLEIFLLDMSSIYLCMSARMWSSQLTCWVYLLWRHMDYIEWDLKIKSWEWDWQQSKLLGGVGLPLLTHLPSSAAYIRQWIGSALVQVITSHLTQCGRVTHICVNKLTIIGSDNGLSPGRRQAIIWTNAGILFIWTLGTNFSEILIAIHAFSFKKMHLKMSSVKWPPFCLGLNVLRL